MLLWLFFICHVTINKRLSLFFVNYVFRVAIQLIWPNFVDSPTATGQKQNTSRAQCSLVNTDALL